MVLLTTTPQILNLISQLPSSLQTKLDSSTPLPTDLASPISHELLVSLSRVYRNDETIPSISLNSLLRGSRPYTPPPQPKPEPSPEYKALMARLRQDQERREYSMLVQRQTQELRSTEEDEEEDVVSPSLVLNILLSVVFCALAVFYLSKWLANDGIRVLMSLATGVVVGIAEVVVYSGYVRNVKDSRRKERAKREKKALIGEYRGPGDEGDAQSVVFQTGDTEVIWGRGKHGGMRRRVREKWEKEQKQEHDKGL